MFQVGDRVTYVGVGHSYFGFVGTIKKLHSETPHRRWYNIVWDDPSKNNDQANMGFYMGNLELYIQGEPDWEI